jgi:hypothetical protein
MSHHKDAKNAKDTKNDEQIFMHSGAASLVSQGYHRISFACTTGWNAGPPPCHYAEQCGVAHVGAGDQQHQQHGCPQHQERIPDIACVSVAPAF